MAIKQPALLLERERRKKKESIKTTPKVNKPTKEVIKNKKGTTQINRATISTKPSAQNATQNRVVTNKERLTSKPSINTTNIDTRTIKTNNKPKRSIQTVDVYERGGKYYYKDGKKEKQVDTQFVQNALKNNRQGVIGRYDSKGQLRRTDSSGNVKEQSLLDKASYLARTAKTRAKKGTISIADAVLQETQNDLKKGENLKTVGDKVAKFASAIFNSNPEQGIRTAVSKAIANSGRIWKDEDKNILQKYVGSVLEGSQAIGTGQMQGLKDIRELAGSYDKNLDEKVAKVQKKLDEPVNKELEQLELEKYNYGKGMRRAADIVGTTANMAPGIATSIITRNPELGILPMALSAKGQTTERALQQGADLDTAIKMGTTSGLIEGGTEQLSGLGLGIFGKGTIDDIVSNAINSKIRNKGINFIAKQGFGLAGEINEELISDLAGLMIDKGTIDPNAKYTFEDFLETVKNTFGSTILMNLLTGGYGSGAYNSNINDMNNFNIQQQQANEVAQRVESGEIDAQEGNALLEQVKDGTYQQNRNLEQIATQERQNLIQAAQQGAISQEQYTQGLQTLANTVNQTREEINKIQTSLQESAARNNLDPESDTVKIVQNAMDKRGIKASFDANRFTDTNTNAFWSIDENGNREVVFNPNATTNDIVEEVAIHEITHDLMSSENSKNALKAEELLDYVKSMEDYESARKSLEETYSQVYDKSNPNYNKLIDEEVVADVLGRKLGNQEFINKLNGEKPNLAKKLYNWVLDKIDNIGKSAEYKAEKKYWRDVADRFENAFNMEYNNNEKADTKFTKFATRENNKELDNSSFSKDNQGRTLTKEQQEFYKDVSPEVRDENGNLKTYYHTTTEEVEPFSVFNPVGTLGYKYGDVVVNFYTDNPIMSGSYADSQYKKYSPDATEKAKYQYEGYINIKNPYVVDSENRSYGKANIKANESATKTLNLLNNLSDNTITELASIKQKAIEKARNQEKLVKELEFLRNGLDKEQKTALEIGEILDATEKYNLNKEAQERNNRLIQKILEREGYTNDWDLDNLKYEYYTNDLGLDLSKYGYTNDKITLKDFLKIENDVQSQNKYAYEFFDEMLNEHKNNKQIEDILNTKFDIKRETRVLNEETGSKQYGKVSDLVYDAIGFDGKLNRKYLTKEGLNEHYIVDGFINQNTNDVIREVLEMNKNGSNYDGVIFKNLYDYGGSTYDLDSDAGDVVVTFNSNQFKLVENKNPTTDDDIRKSQNDSEWNRFLDKNIQRSGTGSTLNDIRIKNNNVNTGPEILDKMPTEKKSIFKQLKEKYNAFRHHFTDHREAWYDLSRETKNPDINSRADAIDLANGKAQVDIGRAQIDYNGKRYKNFTDENGNKVSMSFEGAYDLYNKIPVKAKNEFLVHNLNIDRLNQGVNQFEIPIQESQAKLAKLRQTYPDIDKWSENIYQYYRNNAQKLVDGGRLPQSKVNEWQTTTPHYVHIQRDMGQKGNSGVDTKNGRVDSNRLIQKVKGGNYPILPIKQTTADFTRNSIEALQINNLGKEYLKTVGVGSRADGTQQINDMDDIFGINQDLIKDDGKGNYTFVVYDKGNVIEVPISKDMYEGLKPRDIRKVAVTSDIVKLQREIITNKNPIFGLIRNPAKDVQAMALYSKHGAAKTGSTYAKLFTGRTVGKMFQKNNPNKVSTQDIIDLYYDVGNQANSYYNNGEFESEKRQPRTKAGKALGKVSSALEKGNNFFESMPRITEFWNTIQSEGYTINKSGEGPVLVPIKGKNPTKSVEQVLMEASHDAAEITVNFKRGGTWGKNLDRNFAVYSSPAIQGAAKFGRTVTEAVGDAKSGNYKALTRLVSRAAALGIAPALLSEAMYGDDDDYKDIQEYQKDQYYLIKRPDGKWLRIPKGREISTIQSLTRRGMNKASGEKDAFKGYGSFAINQVGPTNPLESNFASPLISAFLTNRSWSGNPIVSDYMKNNFADEDQYNEKTDELSKWIGKKTGISPMKINYILDQYSGGLGDVALPYITPKANSNTNNPVSSILKNEFSFDQANSSKSVSKFYDAKNEINKAFKKRNASDEDKVKKVYMGTISQSLFELSTKKREIQMDKNLSKKEKYEQALDVQKKMNKLTSDAVKNLDKVDVGENTATIGGILLYKNKNSKNGWSQESEKATKNREKLGLSPEKYYYYKNEESYTPPGKEYSQSITSGKNAKYNIAIVDAFNFDPSDYLEYKYKLSKIRGNKDSRGKTIRYSARNKKLKYLNTLPISAVEKAYLMKQNDKYYKGSDYNLKKAISNSSLSNKEKKELYSYLKLGR